MEPTDTQHDEDAREIERRLLELHREHGEPSASQEPEDEDGPTLADMAEEAHPAAAAETATRKEGKAARSLAAGQVDRVVVNALPEGMHISRDARIALQKTATISLLYLTCLAEEERAQSGKKRSTLTAADLRAGMEAAGMGSILAHMTTNTKRDRS